MDPLLLLDSESTKYDETSIYYYTLIVRVDNLDNFQIWYSSREKLYVLSHQLPAPLLPPLCNRIQDTWVNHGQNTVKFKIFLSL